MTMIQRTAQLSGWLFVILAIWGAALTGTSMDAELVTADRLWGLFPINFLHNLAHLAIGLWGIAASRSHSAAGLYTVAAGALYLLLAILGIFAPTGFGLIPLGGPDIWLHFALGAALMASSFLLRSGVETPTVEPAGTRTVHPPVTASSPEGTVTRPPAEPARPPSGAQPAAPEEAGSEGAAEGAVPPPPPENVVDEPPQQPDRETER